MQTVSVVALIILPWLTVPTLMGLFWIVDNVRLPRPQRRYQLTVRFTGEHFAERTFMADSFLDAVERAFARVGGEYVELAAVWPIAERWRPFRRVDLHP